MTPVGDSFPVVIIGGGLAGLTAAVYLTERGISPLVLEADASRAGGRLQGGEPDSFEHEGRTWSFESEHGMHALWGAYENMRALLERFAPLSLIRSPGEEWLYRRGREVRRAEAGSAVRRTWLPAPLHFFQLLALPRFWSGITLLDIWAGPGFLVSLFLSLAVDPLGESIRWDGLTLDDFFRGWTPNVRVTFTGLARNLLAAPSEAISLTALIAAIRFYTLLRRDAWSLDYLPDNPRRCLIDPLAERIETGGGRLMLGTRAVGLERVADGWRVRIEDARRGARSVLTRQIVLALDPAAARRLLMAGPDTAAEAARLRFPEGLPSLTARLWFDADARAGMPGGMLTGDFGFDNFFWLHRLRDEFRTWHQATGGSCLEMHLYGLPETLDKPDKDFLTLALSEAQRAFPELKGHFTYGAIRRNEACQTRFIVPTRQDSLWVDTPWPGISACGDWIGYATPTLNMERATITGIAAANRLIEAAGGQLFPIIPLRRPEMPARLLMSAARTVRAILGPAARALGWLRQHSK